MTNKQQGPSLEWMLLVLHERDMLRAQVQQMAQKIEQLQAQAAEAPEVQEPED